MERVASLGARRPRLRNSRDAGEDPSSSTSGHAHAQRKHASIPPLPRSQPMMPIGARGFTLVEPDGKDEAGEQKFKMTDLSSIQGARSASRPRLAAPAALVLGLARRGPHTASAGASSRPTPASAAVARPSKPCSLRARALADGPRRRPLPMTHSPCR